MKNSAHSIVFFVVTFLVAFLNTFFLLVVVLERWFLDSVYGYSTAAIRVLLAKEMMIQSGYYSFVLELQSERGFSISVKIRSQNSRQKSTQKLKRKQKQNTFAASAFDSPVDIYVRGRVLMSLKNK